LFKAGVTLTTYNLKHLRHFIRLEFVDHFIYNSCAIN